MEGVLVEIISQFGVLGLILSGIIYLIVEGIKQKRNQTSCSTKIDNSIADLRSHVDGRIDDVNIKIDLVNKKVDAQYEILNSKIDAQPASILKKINDKHISDEEKHQHLIMNQFNIAPKIHQTLKNYRERINCDHIFLGIFHNGSISLSGIPFCKFDVIAEKFKPGYNKSDTEFAAIYKNADIVRHDTLPSILSQEEYVYYKLDENGESPLQEIDDILYRRCVSRGIKQIAINILRDEQMNPIGFVGCVDYDYDELNFKELHNCAKELEEIYK